MGYLKIYIYPASKIITKNGLLTASSQLPFLNYKSRFTNDKSKPAEERK